MLKMYTNDDKHHCECGRALRYLCEREEGENIQYICNRCHEDVLENCKVWWRCQECDVDLCGGCEGLKKNVCPFGHILKEKMMGEQNHLGEEEVEERICDCCESNIDGKFYSC